MVASRGAFGPITGNIALPKFFRFTMKGHCVEANGTSKLLINYIDFYRVSGPGTDTEAQIGAAVFSTFATTAQVAFSDKYIFDAYNSKFFDDPLNLGVDLSPAFTGAIGGDRQPSFNSVVTRKKSGLAGRSQNGSNHWAPVAESDTTLDELNAGAINRWDAFASQLQNLVGGLTPVADTWQPVVLSPTKSAAGWIASPRRLYGAYITTFTANHVIGTMLRRKERP
jgi:hypothetical protein